MISPGENPSPRRDAPSSGPRISISQVEARQGVTGHNVRRVLGFGLGAVAIAFAIIYIIYFV
jgi:hypothetical protein